MKYLVSLSIIVALACGAQGAALKVRFDFGLWGAGDSFFYDIPLYVSDAINQGWTQLPRADDHLPSLEMYCPDEPTFCTMYDSTGYASGIQVALAKDKYTDSVFDWEIQGFTEWEPANDGKRYWTNQQFFVDEGYLAISENCRIKSRKQDQTLQMDGIWVRSFNGQLMKISKNKKDIENTIFTKQSCIPWMGTHYYYNMSATTECTSDGILPWFPLVYGDELVGTGLMTFGSLPIEKGQRDWFERPDIIAVHAIVPRGPECIYNLATKPGLVTMHIYYIEKPQSLLLCL